MQTNDYLLSAQYEHHTAANEQGFVTFQHEDTGLFYFAILDTRGKLLLKSEGYTTEAARDNGMDSVQRNRADETRYKVQQNAETAKYYLSLRAGNHQEIAITSDCDDADAALLLLPFATGQKMRGGIIDDYLPCREYTGTRSSS